VAYMREGGKARVERNMPKSGMMGCMHGGEGRIAADQTPKLQTNKKRKRKEEIRKKYMREKNKKRRKKRKGEG
jgi:hypothetical protein